MFFYTTCAGFCSYLMLRMHFKIPNLNLNDTNMLIVEAKNDFIILNDVSSGLCGMVSTVWFPIGAHREEGLMSFGFSLYAGWVGTIFSLLGGSILICCSSDSSSRSYQDNNRFYYSKQGGGNPSETTSAHHAKSAHV